jgi:hypothetical protein
LNGGLEALKQGPHHSGYCGMTRIDFVHNYIDQGIPSTGHPLKGFDMFYMMPNPLFGNAFQSWMAAARDQATAQLIASLAIQKAIQSRVVSSVETCALSIEGQIESAYEYESTAHVERRRDPSKAKKQLL